jgi:hypothetical protein
MADLIAKERIVPPEIAADRFGVRIEQDLVRVEAMAVRRVIRPMNAVAIQLAR